MNTKDIPVDASFYNDIIRPYIVDYLEMARIAMDIIPADLADQMNLSDDELNRLSVNLNSFMNSHE